MPPRSKGRNADGLAQDSTPNQRSRARKDPWAECREAVYQAVTLRTPTGVQRKPRIAAYLEGLARDAAQGNLPALREQGWLIDFLDKKKILLQPKPKGEGSSLVKQRMQEHATNIDLYLKFRAVIFGALRGEFKKRYTRKYGPRPGFDEIRPADVELERVVPYLRRARGAPRGAGQGSFEVGYRKPPVATRWRKNQSGNPSGKRRIQDDTWEAFRGALLRAVPVIKDGRKTTTTSVAVACSRLFEQAFKGNTIARREVRKLLFQLDKRGLLVPPEPTTRRKRRSAAAVPDRRAEARFALIVVRVLGSVKRDMFEAYSKAYGPIDDFETAFERKWKARSEEPASEHLLAPERE